MICQALFTQMRVVDLAKNNRVPLLALFASAPPVFGGRLGNTRLHRQGLSFDVKPGRYQQASEGKQCGAGRAHSEVAASDHGSGHKTQGHEQDQGASCCDQRAYLF